jgi:hypothetical protein
MTPALFVSGIVEVPHEDFHRRRLATQPNALICRRNSKKITKCIKRIPGIYQNQRHGTVITGDGSQRRDLVARRRLQQVFHYFLCLLNPHIL